MCVFCGRQQILKRFHPLVRPSFFLLWKLKPDGTIKADAISLPNNTSYKLNSMERRHFAEDFPGWEEQTSPSRISTMFDDSPMNVKSGSFGNGQYHSKRLDYDINSPRIFWCNANESFTRNNSPRIFWCNDYVSRRRWGKGCKSTKLREIIRPEFFWCKPRWNNYEK